MLVGFAKFNVLKVIQVLAEKVNFLDVTIGEQVAKPQDDDELVNACNTEITEGMNLWTGI